MAVIEVQEDTPDRRGKQGEKGVVTYTRSFSVITDDPRDGPQIVRQAAGIPRYGDTYESGNDSDPAATCREIEPQLKEPQHDQTKWKVICNYSSANDANSNQPENPLEREADVDWNGAEYGRVVDIGDLVDDSGAVLEEDVQIESSAGKPYRDPAPEIEDSHWIVTITKNLAAVPPWILQYKNAVNSDVFTIDGIVIQIRMARIVAPRIGKWQQENGVRYRQVSIDIDLKDPDIEPLGWILELPDYGLGYLDDDGKFVNSYDRAGQVQAQPIFLDGNGNPLDLGDDRVYRRYRVRKEISYAPIAALL